MPPARAAPRRRAAGRAAPPRAAPRGGGGRAALARLADRYASMQGYEKPDLPPAARQAASAAAGRASSPAPPPAAAPPARAAGYLKLDSNENMAMPRQFQADLLRAARKAVDVREYPLGGGERLAGAIARHLRVPASSVGIGSGSDQILDQLLAAFVAGQGGRVLASSPTFAFFEDRCRLYSVPVTSVPYSDDMTLDAEALRAACRAFKGGRRGAPCMLYLDMPNNPTGFQLGRADLEDVASAFDGLVVIDEAYAEFAGYTAVRWTRRIDNLAVVRTFSKSFGLAGLRLGYFAAGGRIAEAYNRAVGYPYPVSSLAVEAGIEALRRSGQVRAVADLVRRERARVARELRSHGAFEVFDSSANFVLFDAGGAHRRVHAALAEQGISVRRLGRIGRREGCLRVTIGTREMNSRFLLAVRDLLG